MGHKRSLDLEEFTFRMVQVSKDFCEAFLGGLEKRIDVFALQVRQNRMPDFLRTGETFLGKYLIVGIVPYSEIYQDNLMRNRTVFKL